MFQGILQVDPRAQNNIEAKINWARETLQREDRIIWYLRLVQAHFFGLIIDNMPEKAQAAQKKRAQIARKMGMDERQLAAAAADLSRFQTAITHHLSMPIMDIQRYQWGNQTPDKILADFEEIERQWAEDKKRSVRDDGAVKLIDFGNGTAWWDLERAYCPQEAACMGHCGNSPRQHTDDTLLSLRSELGPDPDDGEMIYSCHLTFVLDDDGMLGEMKGRGNDKPTERYHKYIIPLLRHERVEGIKGGGYMPENNFNMNDLDDETREELEAEKPGLANPMDVVEKYMEAGEYDKGLAAIEDAMGQHGLPYHMFEVDRNEYSWEEGKRVPKGRESENWRYWNVTIQEWRDFDQFIREFDDKPVEQLLNQYEELKESDAIDEEGFDQMLTPDFVLEMLEYLPPREQATVTRGLGVGEMTGGVDDLNTLERAAQAISKGGNANRFWHYFLDAFNEIVYEMEGEEVMAEGKKQVMARLEAYIDAGYYGRPSQIGYDAKDPNNQIEGEWIQHIGLGDILEILRAGAQGDTEYGWDDEHYSAFHEWKDEYNGWLEVDWIDERRRDEGPPDDQPDLNDMNEDDALVSQIEEQGFDLDAENLAKPVAARVAKILRMRESQDTDLEAIMEDCFDDDFEDILRRALG